MILPIASIFTDIPEAIVVFFHDTLGFKWGFAIIALTFTIRLAILPLSLKQIRSMRAMQVLQPQLKEIQTKFKDDRQRQQQEMMRFYKENEINPLASCLPLVLQLPVFFALYAMLRGDSFKQDVIASGDPSFFVINSIIEKPQGTILTVVLIALFVGTQLAAGLSMQVRGQGLEGPQRFIVYGLPFAFAPFVASFPAGLSIYWIATNVWTFAQQNVVLSMMPPPPKAEAAQAKAAEAKSTKAPPPPPRKKKRKRR